MEVWKTSFYCGDYEVSDLGRVRRISTDRMIKGSRRPDGYIQLAQGAAGTVLLHRLVLSTFEGECPVGMWGLHEDDDRSNNRLSNLYWGTPAKNAADQVMNRRKRGLNAPAARLDREKVLAICAALDTGARIKDVAAQFGEPPQLITHINVGRFWGWLTGRDASRSRNPAHGRISRKLDAVTVKQLVDRLDEGGAQRVVAREFGITQATVSNIHLGKLWSHVTGRS